MLVIQVYNSDKKACTSVLDTDGNSLKRMYCLQTTISGKEHNYGDLISKGNLKSG